MRIINSVPWTSQEIEIYRSQIFLNLVQGMRLLLDSLKDMSDHPPPSLSFPTPTPTPTLPPLPRQRSESGSSNASTSVTTHTGTALGGIPSQRPHPPRRKLTYSARHAQLHAQLDGVPDLREGDPFPPEVGDILIELWGVETGVKRAGSRNISVTRGDEAERVVEIDAKETSIGQNDLRECVERAKVGGNLPDK